MLLSDSLHSHFRDALPPLISLRTLIIVVLKFFSAPRLGSNPFSSLFLPSLFVFSLSLLIPHVGGFLFTNAR